MPALRTRDTQSRPLEVTTDAPQPPTLTIISPTPRAFTFPISHNLSSDSPYSTPSNSPFEPDLTSLAISSVSSCITPPPRTFSPTSSFTSVSPSPTSYTTNSHLSQKSLGSDAERRPKKGDEDYIKRPENAFILFRRKCCEEHQAAEDDTASSRLTKKQRQADLSKTISHQWKSLTLDERKYWENLAKEKKKEHAQMYPGYVYRPQRVRDKDGKARNKKRKPKVNSTATAMNKDTESMSFVVAPARQHGRSASAPTPPPMSYQSIQIPNLYSSSPSCPTSPSLLPMISRRTTHSGNSEDLMADFDFMPSHEHLLAPAFGTEQPNFQMSELMCVRQQSSEFLRNIFNMTSHEAPLSVSTDTSLLLPAHHIVSPASTMGTSSSGPSSPATGPFTPTHSTHPRDAFNLGNIPSSAFVPDSHMQTALDMQIQMSGFNFSGNYWPMQSVWQDESNMMHGDFDLSSIPSLEMGGPKYVDATSTYLASPEAMEMNEYSQEYQQEYSNECLAEYQQEYVQFEHSQYFEGHQSTESSLLGYDNMMGSPEQGF
ncbi:hypothetical protein J3R30DRAFT_3684848 [Lentinula aciculospora]|uniref:HMG box domain-containing protein n=1 Tax=Lentinula aciculospora TaxID=153920 RepID=A0A9W9A448_9AGAR|nr:hypothetical protein J3R30DRAFT_3684848 [Lentinula aciculospora]